MVATASWWKKATLGIHYIPNITIQKMWQGDCCWLLIENPLEESIALACESILFGTNSFRVLMQELIQ